MSTRFTDTKGHYAEKAIELVAAAGLMKGDPEGTFRPNDSLKRGEFAMVIARILGLQDGAPTTPTTPPPVELPKPERTWEEVIADVSKAVVKIDYLWNGTGFVVNGRYIVTAGHVMDGLKETTIRFADGKTAKAVPFLRHPNIGKDEYDIGILKFVNYVHPHSIPVTDDKAIVANTEIVMLGYGGNSRTLETHKGTIVSVATQDEPWEFDIDLSKGYIVGGHSGSPVVSKEGEALGVVVQNSGDSTNLVICRNWIIENTR